MNAESSEYSDVQDDGFDPGFDPSPTPPAGESLVPAILAGLGAALVGGIAWTVIMAFTGYELGIAAWALGGLVGFGMSRATSLRGPVPAASAAVLALVGLLIARVLIGEFVLASSGVGEVLADQELMVQATTVDLQVRGGFPEELQARYDAIPEGDTLSDALWAEMLTAGEAHLASMSDDERSRVAEQFASFALGSLGMTGRITAQMGAFDIVWALLAVSTAWGMMRREEEPVPVAAVDEGDFEDYDDYDEGDPYER